jgi:hypothetical protein
MLVMAEPETGTGVPGWVKVFGLIAAALALVVVAVMLISGGEHGPGRHMSSGLSTPVVGVEERG